MFTQAAPEIDFPTRVETGVEGFSDDTGVIDVLETPARSAERYVEIRKAIRARYHDDLFCLVESRPFLFNLVVACDGLADQGF